jgi:hypothetical protein
MAHPNAGSRLRGAEKPLTAEETAALCMQAVLIIPQLLEEIRNTLEDIADAGALMSLYTERMGLESGILKPEDIQEGEDGSSKDGGTGRISADIRPEADAVDKG